MVAAGRVCDEEADRQRRSGGRASDRLRIRQRPTCYKATRQYISFFVNRRWVQSRTLNYAVEEAYHSLLLTGRHPVAVVNIALDPALIDVNVHPAKTEVRFLRERLVYAAVAAGGARGGAGDRRDAELSPSAASHPRMGSVRLADIGQSHEAATTCRADKRTSGRATALLSATASQAGQAAARSAGRTRYPSVAATRLRSAGAQAPGAARAGAGLAELHHHRGARWRLHGGSARRPRAHPAGTDDRGVARARGRRRKLCWSRCPSSWRHRARGRRRAPGAVARHRLRDRAVRRRHAAGSRRSRGAQREARIARICASCWWSWPAPTPRLPSHGETWEEHALANVACKRPSRRASRSRPRSSAS